MTMRECSKVSGVSCSAISRPSEVTCPPLGEVLPRVAGLNDSDSDEVVEGVLVGERSDQKSRGLLVVLSDILYSSKTLCLFPALA